MKPTYPSISPSKSPTLRRNRSPLLFGQTANATTTPTKRPTNAPTNTTQNALKEILEPTLEPTERLTLESSCVCKSYVRYYFYVSIFYLFSYCCCVSISLLQTICTY